MNFRGCLVTERAGRWFIAVGDDVQYLSPPESIEELVTCVDLMVKQAGAKNVHCVLAPETTSCFFATLTAGEDMDVRDRTALLYELEDHLPIDAESMVADFVAAPHSPDGRSTVSAVAVEVHRWRGIADAFEAAGYPIRCVVPAAVLVSRSICRGTDLTETIQYFFVDQTHCDAVTIRSETIIAWKSIHIDPKQLDRHRRMSVGEPDRVVVLGADESQRGIIAGVYGDAEFATDSIDHHLIRGAELALTKQSNRWFDLRRDQLGPSDPLRPIQTHLRVVAVAALVFLLSLVIGGWWRTRRIENQISSVRAQQRTLFQEAFPDAKIPGALLRRVRSEHARVMGSRGASSQVDVPQSAVWVLRQLLAALPSDLRFRLTLIDITNGSVELDLQVRSPVDAGQLATALTVAGFDVKPPVTTQKDSKTFQSVLEAAWVGPSELSASPGDVSLRVSIDGEVRG